MKLLDIGEVAAKSGLQPSALRHYEEAGLISPVARHGLRRQFEPLVLMQLKLIAMGKSAGFSLEAIAGMFGRDGLQLPRPAMHQRADEIDRQIRELTSLSILLRHVADCRAPSHLQCPTFRRLMDLAARRASRTRARKTPKRPSAKT
jgi:DNA-binding transcriptional MerR regulator